MKIQCLDREGTIPNTFLCKINQHTILLNCPIELLTIPQQRGDGEPEDNSKSDLSSILSSFSSQGKRAADTRSNLAGRSVKNCDHATVFRVPDFNLIDIHSIDLVLISNSELMLGLPYLTEYMGYKGRIIATEPTIEYAKQRMEELVAFHGKKTSMIASTRATHFSQLDPLLATDGWQSLYTIKDIISCVEKIQPVRYTETLSLFSTLQLVAHSSGHSLGSANWLLETSFKRICFMSSSSNRTDLHPAPLDPLILKNVDVLVVGGLKEASERELDFEKTRSKIFALIARTIQSLHNVVLVSSLTGVLFDLIGDLEAYFLSIGKEIGHERHQVPIYVVGPMADSSLKYANICGEWMNPDRHELLYKPSMPLAHGELMRTNAVIPIDNLEAALETRIREPCIVFTGDPTCINKGSLFWFLNYWGSSELNTCIFIDPKSPQRIQEDIPNGCKMSFNRLVLDTRLQFENLSSLLENNWNSTENRRFLLIPNIKGADTFKQEEQQENLNIHIYEQGEIVTIDLKRDWEKVSVNEKLASMIEPMIIPNQTTKNSNVSVWAPIHGSLSYYNNLLEIKPSTNIKDDPSLLNHATESRINTELNSIIKKFEEYSIPIHITRDINGITTIELPKDMNAKITMNGLSTTIVANDDKIRNLLRKITIL